MTGKLDAAARTLAKNKISEFGKSVTIRRTTSTYDPATGKPSETTSDTSTVGILAPFGERLIDGSLVQIGDMQLTVAAKDLGITPDNTKDAVIIDSETWQVVRVDYQWSGAQVAMYRLHLRK